MLAHLPVRMPRAPPCRSLQNGGPIVALTPEQRSQRARLAALTRWSKEDPRPNADRGQAGLLARFEREVDPNNELAPAERTRRAEAARRAHMVALAFKSSKSRSKDEKGSEPVRTPDVDQQPERESAIRARFARIQGEVA